MNTALIIPMQRKQEVSSTHPARYQALRQVADNLSLRNVDAAICELMNEALCRVITLAYEQDAGGLCNVDEATGKILIPLPWGRNGQSQWGLRPQESNILREILFTWQGDHPTLLAYDRTRRSWFVNLADFPNYHLAKRWITQHQISITTYRAARAKRVQRV